MMSFASGPPYKTRTWTSVRRVRTLEILMLSTVRSFRAISIGLLLVRYLLIRIERELIMLRSDGCYCLSRPWLV